MIQLSPQLSINISCILCSNTKVIVNSLHLAGVHFLAKCTCNVCRESFYYTLPSGHALRYPIAISTTLEKAKYAEHETLKWIVDPLIQAIKGPNDNDITIEIKKNKESDSVIFLNCLDYLYGHVLLKIFNAQYYLENVKDKGVILIIPRNFEWLVPKGVAQLWVVDVKMSETRQWFTKLDSLFNSTLNSYKNVFLSLAFPSPDPSKIEIERFTGVKRFDINEFENRKPVVTFIYREDRLWLPFRFLHTISIYSQLLKLKSLNKILLSSQNIRIKRFAKLLHNKIPECTINLVGLGTKGKMPSYVKDFRTKKINSSIEIEWCKLYAASHLVVGVHGSNMLLPTALAAGYIEILPSDRFGNILQDILSPYTGREQHFLGRFVNENISPRKLVFIIYSVITKFPHFKRSMQADYLEHKLYTSTDTWLVKY